jgi:hypothetical protein
MLVASLMLCPRVSLAMEIEMFDALAPQDQRDYLEYLVDTAGKILIEQGRGDSAAKVEQLFSKKVSGRDRSQGDVLFHAQLARARAYAAENPTSPIRIDLVSVLTQTLVSSGVLVPPATFLRQFEQALRQKPFWPKLPLLNRAEGQPDT